MGRWKWFVPADEDAPIDGCGPATVYPNRSGAFATDQPVDQDDSDPTRRRIANRGDCTRGPVVTGHLPEVEPGTILGLAKGEWSTGNMFPAEHNTVIRVAKVHTDRVTEGAGGVRVTGHGLECAWQSSDCTTPCTQVYVYLDVLAREAAAAPAREAGDE